MLLKIPDPTTHWDIISLPLARAPLETPSKPLLFDENETVTAFWSYPTQVEFVAYPTPSHYCSWVMGALEKYRIHLTSPFDLPYTLIARAPLTLH